MPETAKLVVDTLHIWIISGVATVISAITGLGVWAVQWLSRRMDGHDMRLAILEREAGACQEIHEHLTNCIDEVKSIVEASHEENRQDHKELMSHIIELMRRNGGTHF